MTQPLHLKRIEAGHYNATIQGIQITCYKCDGLWTIELQGKNHGESVTEWTKADCLAWAADMLPEFIEDDLNY